METSIIVGIGSIAVGLIAGILTLLKTAGAKREKIKTSYKEIITILIRSLTQSQMNITSEELDRIVRSKCRNYRLNRSDLFSDIEIANDIYTNVLENEFIAPPEKKKILGDIDKLINGIPKEKPTEEVTGTIERPQAFVSMLMAILSTIVAMTVLIITSPALKMENVELISTIIIITVAMIATLFTFEEFSKKTKEKLLEKEKEETTDLSKNE